MCKHAFQTIKLNIVKIISFLTCFMATASTAAGVHEAIETESKWSYQIGADAWRLKASANKDSDPGYVSESSNLLLPNAYTKWKYSDVSGYGWLIGQQSFSNRTSSSLKIRVDQTLGWRIDEAEVKTYFSPFFGVRYGIVDYKTSWCRNYEPDNNWIREVETICSTPQFRDVTGGSPGAQIFANVQLGDYSVQSQIGIYRPLLLGYAHREFGNLVPSDNYRVLANEKIGINFNLINLINAAETRISYIKGYQRAYLPEIDLAGNFQQTSDMIYLGFNLPITSNITGRVTHLQQIQHASCRSNVAKFASACNLNLTFDKHASSAELSYRWSNLDSFSLGISRTGFEINQDLFTSTYDIYSADLTYLKVRQSSAAWRHHWGRGFFSVVQAMRSQQMNAQRDFGIGSHGSAIGFRIGYQY
jgi:hypothetical protein